MTAGIKKFRIGNFESTLIHVDSFVLDGGAMFGIVPKNLWTKVYDCDEKNQITLFGSLFLVKAKGSNIIVETGMGTKLSGKESQSYRVKNEWSIKEALFHCNMKPEDIDFVILTHLHLDHAGGSTEILTNEVIPVFKNAQYIVQKDEYEVALNSNERTQGSYKEDDFLPLEKSGNLKLVEGEYELTEGVKVVKTGGHTTGHQVVFFESEGEKLVHLGDLVPTSAHIPLPYIMAYDTHPMTTLEMRKKLYGIIVQKGMKAVFPHDISHKIALHYDFSPGNLFR